MNVKASEVLIVGSEEKAVQISQNNTSTTRDYSKKITYQEALDNLKGTSSENNNTLYFLNEEDKETKRFFELIRKNVVKTCINSGDIENIKIRGRKQKGEFAVWVGLKNNKGGIKFDNSFLRANCDDKGIKVTALTIVETPDLKRTLRISRNDRGDRFYEIITSSHSIQCNWSEDGKDYSLTVNVSDEGKVTFTNPSDKLTYEDLEKNTFVTFKIGKGEKITLYELCTKEKECKSSEIITANPQGTPDVSKGETPSITITETTTQKLAENQEREPGVSKGETPSTIVTEIQTQGVEPQVKK